ncbi:hypothetical protein ACVILK_004766 [Bradyrhizobium embrapense]
MRAPASPIAIADSMTPWSGDIIAVDDGFEIAANFGAQKRGVLCGPLPKAHALGRSRLSSR